MEFWEIVPKLFPSLIQLPFVCSVAETKGRLSYICGEVITTSRWDWRSSV